MNGLLLQNASRLKRARRSYPTSGCHRSRRRIHRAARRHRSPTSSYRRRATVATLHIHSRTRSVSSLSYVVLKEFCSRKNLISVKWSFDKTASAIAAKSVESTADGETPEPKSKAAREDEQSPICPSCKKELSNNTLMHRALPAYHVSTAPCVGTDWGIRA